jgi:hypothetical protein
MKVNGPGSAAGGAPPVPPSAPRDGAGAVDRASQGAAAGTEKSQPAGRTFAETLAAARAPEPGAEVVAPAKPAHVAAAVDPLTSDIAADLEAGRIDPRAALDRVVERVLDQQLGSNAPSALREQVRDALRDTISSDPMLTDLLHRQAP